MRPGEGGGGGEIAPGFQIGEIGGEGAQGVFAHAVIGQMFEGGDIVIGQDGRELVTTVEGQDAVQSIELLGPPQGVGGHRRRRLH